GGHLTVYAVLAVLYQYALAWTEAAWQKPHSKERPDRSRLLAIGLSLLYAISDEWHQSFTPGRNPSALDVAIDVVGSVIGLSVLQLAQRFHDRHQGDGSKETRLPHRDAAHLDEL